MKRAVLVVSFGTSYEESRRTDIGAVEAAVGAAFPGWEVRRAFTSGMIVRSLRAKGVWIDTVDEALERLAGEGFEELVIQPTHVMPGREYDGMMEAVKRQRGRFSAVRCGAPLLWEERDYMGVTEILREDAAPYIDGRTAMVFMGHGTDHWANEAYSRLNERLCQEGQGRIFVGTVEASPDIEETIAAVGLMGVQRVVLKPFMIVAGDHASNDMAGDEEDSWKNRFEGLGYEVVCLIEGMGRNRKIGGMFAGHAERAWRGDGE